MHNEHMIIMMGVTSLETFGLDPVQEGLPDLVVATRHVLPIRVLPFLLRLLLHSPLQQVHLDVGSLVLCDDLVHCSALTGVGFRVE